KSTVVLNRSRYTIGNGIQLGNHEFICIIFNSATMLFQPVEPCKSIETKIFTKSLIVGQDKIYIILLSVQIDDIILPIEIIISTKRLPGLILLYIGIPGISGHHAQFIGEVVIQLKLGDIPIPAESNRILIRQEPGIVLFEFVF